MIGSCEWSLHSRDQHAKFSKSVSESDGPAIEAHDDLACLRVDIIAMVPMRETTGGVVYIDATLVDSIVGVLAYQVY